MPCFHPIEAWKSPAGEILFRECVDGLKLELPCGRCVGCRLERSRQWAVRITHEAKLHGANCFITLTYDEDHMPVNGSLTYTDFQLFMKRLRKRLGSGIRFYMAGEYGESLDRPHFHACLFGCDFSSDRLLWSNSGGNRLYRSPTLEMLWPFGFSTIGPLTFDSAAYVARYVMKKVNGDQADEHYKRVDESTGEVYWLTPEFARMSLRPGVGAGFVDRFLSDVYPRDYVVVNGKRAKPPRFYDKRFERLDPDAFDQIKADRELAAAQNAADNTWPRLAAKEAVCNAAVNSKVRKL